ncbi:MAG: thiazole biosynthesis adenylyltransferase ThiF, partial [Phycisphaerales bacterium]|nr:thiazole biosynthesis adenylyltransferase ThiF [Phycisphaerales bacterium]
QTLLPAIGAEGQRQLGEAHVLIVGSGALGCVIADALTRAGVGRITIVDRDVVEITNLQRQILFDESDVDAGTPKAIAAATRLRAINGAIEIIAHVDDFNHRNAERLLGDADVIVDGLDNFQTRYILNDLAVERGVAYIYGGAVATGGVSLPVLPHADVRMAAPPRRLTWTDAQSTPCLRCVFPEAPPPGTTPTCDTAGVLGPLVMTIGAHQATQTLKLLTGNIDALDRRLLSIDVWSNEWRRFDVSGARRDARAACPCCVEGRFEHLDGSAAGAAITLCGRNAVQMTGAAETSALDLDAAAARLASHGSFHANDFLLRGVFRDERGPDGDAIELTLFSNGRAIIKGTTEPELARSIYARYVGI